MRQLDLPSFEWVWDEAWSDDGYRAKRQRVVYLLRSFSGASTGFFLSAAKWIGQGAPRSLNHTLEDAN